MDEDETGGSSSQPAPHDTSTAPNPPKSLKIRRGMFLEPRRKAGDSGSPVSPAVSESSTSSLFSAGSHSESPVCVSPSCLCAPPGTQAIGCPSMKFKRGIPSALSQFSHSSSSEPSSSTELVPFANQMPSAEDAEEAHLATKMARLKSPSKPSKESSLAVSLVCAHAGRAESTLSKMSSLVTSSGKVFLSVGGRHVTEQELAATKQAQRKASTGLYSSEYFFALLHDQGQTPRISDENRLCRTSLTRAPEFVCHGIKKCTQGDCLSIFESADVLIMRTRYAIKCTGSSLTKVLQQELHPFFDRSLRSWNLVPVPVDEHFTAHCCVASFCLLVGASPTVARTIIHFIESNECVPTPVPLPKSVKEQREQKSLDWTMLRQYVANLLNKHEAAPAPGAHQPGKMTYITKQTWRQKWAACEVFFQEAGRVPGSQSMLKRVWRLEHRLKERRAKSHSKCSTCADISAKYARLYGINSDEAKTAREYLDRLAVEHEAHHLQAREELDEAGLQSIVNPRHIWTICVDAATQRNFELPKFQFRPPKSFTGMPFWGFKLMATYTYGDGFRPFLVHDSQPYGPNLTWTVIWLTLMDLRRKRGYWPSVIHIQLDNTTGENKNEIMIMLSAWLAATKVRQVRVYFLPVGHTHIIIDHIFGVITVGLRRKELLLPRELMQNIDESMASCPVYSAKPTQWLHCLWDFSDWAKKTIQHHPLERLFGGDVQDEDGTYTGMYDLLFTRDETNFALLQYREHCSHAYQPSSGPCLTIKHLPTAPPRLQELKPKSKWGMCNTNSIESTIVLSCRFARSVFNGAGEQLVINEWQKIIEAVPTSILLLKPHLKLTFEFFDNLNLPRLMNPGAEVEEDNDKSTDISYEDWKRAFMGFRTGPLAIDPVISSEQSSKEFEAKQAAYRATLGFSGPSKRRSTPVFLGSFVLACTSAPTGVRLFAVRKLGPMMTCVADDITLKCVEYSHTPNPKVSGLFGSFVMRTTAVGNKKQQHRMTLNRSHIVVYNACLKPAGKLRVLTLETLRCLSMALPIDYPMPAQNALPETHLVRVPKPAKKTSAGPRRGATLSWDSSDEDSDSGSAEGEDGADDGSGDDAGHGSAHDSSSNDSESSSDTADDESDDDENDGPVADTQNSEGDQARIRSPAVIASVPQYEPYVPEDGSLCLVNMQGDRSKEYSSMRYPVALVFVQGRSNDAFTRETMLNVCEFKLSTADFNLSLKYQTWNKYWTDPKWPTLEKLKKRQQPTSDQIFKYWYKTLVEPDTIVPVRIPANMYETSKVIQKDNIKLPTEFITGILIPYYDNLP